MKINILGAGGLGSALAINLGQKHKVRLIALPEFVAEIKAGKNRFFPHFQLPKTVEVDTEFSSDVEVVFITTPAQEIVNIIARLQKLNKNIPIIFCSKGLLNEAGKPFLMTTYAQGKISNPVHVFCGPTFAHELAALKKSFANIAGPHAKELCKALTQEHLILEPWHDVIGLQVTGCLKNVFAVAAGYNEGMGKGLNEKAALFSQAFKEMITFGVHFWPKKFDPMTLMTYGGVGDLVLTCTSTYSRSFRLGIALAQGQTLKENQEKDLAVAEGAYTAIAIHEMKGGLDMGICEQIYKLVH